MKFLTTAAVAVSALLLVSFSNPKSGDAAHPQARLRRIYFNPYTDSIKPVLNYYVNVEGEYANGTYLPLDSVDIILTCDRSRLVGNEWILPKVVDFEKVTFTAVARENPRLRDTLTLWIQKWKDPRDAPDYVDPDADRGRD